MNKHLQQQLNGRRLLELAIPQQPRADSNSLTPLPLDFTPGPYDVICARGSVALNHEGNRWFRSMINEQIQAYSKAKSRFEKSLIVLSIFTSVKTASPNGGFVRRIKGRWHSVSDDFAREKIGQSFRNIFYTKFKATGKTREDMHRSVSAPSLLNESTTTVVTNAKDPTVDTTTPVTITVTTTTANSDSQQTATIDPSDDVASVTAATDDFIDHDLLVELAGEDAPPPPATAHHDESALHVIQNSPTGFHHKTTMAPTNTKTTEAALDPTLRRGSSLSQLKSTTTNTTTTNSTTTVPHALTNNLTMADPFLRRGSSLSQLETTTAPTISTIETTTNTANKIDGDTTTTSEVQQPLLFPGEDGDEQPLLSNKFTDIGLTLEDFEPISFELAMAPFPVSDYRRSASH